MTKLLLSLLTAWMLVGCAASPPYRTTAGPDDGKCTLEAPHRDRDGSVVWESGDSRCASSWAVRSDHHSVNYIEIDEQGVIDNRRSMEDALAQAGRPSASGKPAYVLVFVHGWHHNGSADDGNVQAFHSALEALKKWHGENDVRGIYISWRGESFNLPVLRYLTFWDRKNTSDEVGRGGLLEFLLRLERAVKPQATKESPVPPSPNKLVLIGHSFGASVTFNALAHVYMERFIDGVYSTVRAPRFRGYGDLVVLVNPAIEAMRYTPFQTAINYYATRTEAPRADFEFDPIPRLVILSSQGDWATRITFPAARFFSTLLEKHDHIGDGVRPADGQQLSEWVLDRDAVGNHEDFATHWPLHIVTRSGPLPNEAVASDSAKIKTLAQAPERSECNAIPREDVIQLLAAESAVDPTVKPASGAFEEFPGSLIQIVRKPSPVKGSPYVLADVGKEIIADHSQIDNKNLICWIDQLVSAE